MGRGGGEGRVPTLVTTDVMPNKQLSFPTKSHTNNNYFKYKMKKKKKYCMYGFIKPAIDIGVKLHLS